MRLQVAVASFAVLPVETEHRFGKQGRIADYLTPLSFSTGSPASSSRI
jgi:hypothetical protein